MQPTDRRDHAVADVLRGDDRATVAKRYDVQRATLTRWLREAGVKDHARLGAPTRATTARPDRYADQPLTEKARRVWDAWQAAPDAGTMEIARRARVSPGYASRLIGHWRAQEQSDAA